MTSRSRRGWGDVARREHYPWESGPAPASFSLGERRGITALPTRRHVVALPAYWDTLSLRGPMS